MIANILYSAGVCFFVVALVILLLLFNDRRYQKQRLLEERQRNLGLPPGELVYEDADGQGEPLSSNHYPLVGKPDYVVQLPDGRPVPVELKLNVQGATVPFSNHEVQLAAYCLILEEYFPESPPTHGILRYADCEFTVDYTPALKRKVIRHLEQMTKCTETQPPPLATQRAAKCRACSYQAICTIGHNK